MMYLYKINVGKNCTQITTGNRIIGLLYSTCIMQVVYEDHGAKIITFFEKKKLRIDEVSLLQLNTCAGTCICTHNICVNNLSNIRMKLLMYDLLYSSNLKSFDY